MLLLTLFFICFLMIPAYLKRTGIRLMQTDRKNGLTVFALSRILFWYTIVQIVVLWLPEFSLYIWIGSLPFFAFSFFANRRIFFSKTLKRKEKETSSKRKSFSFFSKSKKKKRNLSKIEAK